MAAGCEKPPPPPSQPAAGPPAAPVSAVEVDANAAAIPEPEERLRELDVASPREADLAFLVNGEAALALFARGAGALGITIESDGEPPQSRTIAIPDSPRAPATCPLPGAGTRALRVTVSAPEGATIVSARLRDEAPAQPPPSRLAGCLKGRSLAIVLCDALHAAHLRSWGAQRETSPCIDRLGREGVRFAAARSQTAWTVPSVATLFTGLPQERHGVIDVGIALDAGVPTLAQEFAAAGYATAAFLQNKLVTREIGLDRGFQDWDEFPGESRNMLLPKLRRRWSKEESRPSFTYVHFLPPHAPYSPPPEFAERFGAPLGETDGSLRTLARLARQDPKPDDPQVQRFAALYDNNVAFADSQVAEIVELLAQRGRDKVALLFVSDHGEAFGQHGELGHNAQVYEEMVHVPMLLWAPGSALPAGAVIDEPVWLPDVLPSLCELFGLDVPGGHGGRSFAPLIEAGAAPCPRVLRLSARYHLGQPFQRAIAFGSFKLVSPAGSKVTALFDLAKDPGETTDCSSEHPVLAAALRAELAEWAAEPVAQPGSTFKPNDALEKEMRELGYVGDDER